MGMTMSRSLVVACAVSVSAFVPSTAQGQDRGLTVLEGAADRYAGVETLCADFTQLLQVPLLGSERTGRGRVCQGRPNLFGMRFTEPAGDLIVVDGNFAWVYFPSNDEKTVLKTSADRSAGGRDFHREFLVDPAVKYEVVYETSEVVAGHPTHRLRLKPRQSASYRSAVLWIDDGTPVLRQIRLEEENGNVRTITLENVGFNATPAADFFRFTPPAGALVITR
jgi:outer membrane lipoprotein-sorting protein